MNIDEQITQFNDLLRRLIVEYDIFFSGGRKKPPLTLKFKVDALSKRLLETRMNYGQKFQYNQLVARLSLYRDVWRRNMRELEEGGQLRSRAEIDRLLKSTAKDVKETPEELSLQIQEPVGERGKITQLYEYLLELRKRHGETHAGLELESFAQLVVEKTREIRSRYGCDTAEFVAFYDPGRERVRFLVKAKRDEGPSADQTLTDYVYRL